MLEYSIIRQLQNLNKNYNLVRIINKKDIFNEYNKRKFQRYGLEVIVKILLYSFHKAHLQYKKIYEI